jgi:hypothetical protein
MKALIQKDLKENLKLALIGLLILSVILLQSYQSCITALTNLLAGRMSGAPTDLQPLLATGLLTETMFFCAIFGAALGWLQTRNESHPDLWAFLVHRPVTRTEIFLGKSVAGLCLYFFGAGLPLAILLAVVRMPGHIAAPFEWPMVLPLVSIFLAGVPFYFAGLLTGRRQARWYVSRSFGLGLAIIAAAGVFVSPEFWISFIGIVVAVGILATAAWGAYESGGFYRGQPMKGKLASIVTIAVGCGVALFAGLGLLFTLIVNPLTSHSDSYSFYLMTRDGTIYKETMRDNEIVELVDLEGHPLLDPATGEKIKPNDFQKRLAAYGGYVFTNLRNHKVNRSLIEDRARFFNLVNVTDKTLWYLDRHGKLTGYDSRTRRFAGTLEAHGPDDKRGQEPFLLDANFYYRYNPYNDVSRNLLPSAKTVYLVDFKERSVKPIFTLTNDDEIGGYFDRMSGYDDSHDRFLITTRKIVVLMNYEGQTIFTLPYQPGYLEYPQVQLSILGPEGDSTNHFAVWFHPDWETNRASGWKMSTHVVWLGREQSVTKEAELPTLRPTETVSWPDEALATLTPPALHASFDHKINNVWSLCCLGWAVISAIISLFLARRYNFSTKARVGWTVFAFLFGITGLLALLCVEEWPVRETCPNCKKLRAVDRESCEYCGSPFSPPEKNGVEIFAPLSKV